MSEHISFKRFIGPGKIAVFYLIGTYVLFWIGPVRWEVDNPLLLTVFVLSAFAAFWVGYLRAFRSKAIDRIKVSEQTVPKLLLYAGAVLNILFAFGLLQSFFSGDLSTVANSILDPGSGYKMRIGTIASSEGASNFVVQITILLAVFRLAVIPILAVFWTKLTLLERIVGLGSVLAAIFPNMITGVNINLFHEALFGGVCVLAARAATGKKINFRQLRIPIALLAVFLAAFSYLANSRASAYGSSVATFNRSFATYDSSAYTTFLPQPLVDTSALAISYFTLGYAGLSRDLDQPFVWTYGIGSSVGAMEYADQYLGVKDLFQATYLQRAQNETGWPALRYWSTAWPWWASDVTFPGAIVLTGIFAWIWALAWRLWLAKRNLWSLVTFANLTVLVVFLPANNQIFQSRQALWASVPLLFVFAYQLRNSRKVRGLQTA